MKIYLILFSIVLLAMVHVSVIAQPATITYQGKLLDSINLPVNASNVNMSFAIYDASSGGTKLWPSSTAATKTVNVNVGLYSVILGTGSGNDDAFTASMFSGSTPYLEVTVEGSTLPRTAISNVPFALIANQLNGSGWASPGAIGSTTPSSATFTNVTIGVAPTSYTLPSSRGTNGQILQTDGSGNVSWVNNAGAGPAGGDLSGTYPNPSIAVGAVTSSKIADSTITSADISPSAAIPYSKLSLTNSVQNSDLVANSVTTSKVANGTVTTSKMADSAVSGLKLLTYAVTNRHIADGAVTLPKIDPAGASSGNVITYNGSSVVWGAGGTSGSAGGDLTGTYPNPTIANDAITSAKIADGTITNADIIAAAGISYSKLSLTNSVQNSDLVANSVTTSKVANGTVTTSKMADSAVSGLKLLTYAVTNRHIADGAVTLPKIDPAGASSGNVITYNGSSVVWGSGSTGGSAGGDLTGTYPNPTIANDAVTSAKIADGTITNADIIAAAGISYSKLSLTNSVQNSDLVANSVTTSKVANGTVTTSKMADSAVSGLKLLTYAVTNRHIADGAVTLSKIDPTGASSGNVISFNGSSVVWGSGSTGGSAGGDLTGTYPNPTIANDAVTSAKIADGTITNADIIAAAGIPYSKLSLNNSIQNIDIVANAITTSKVANGTVTTSKLADSAVSGLKLLTFAVTNRHLAANAVTTDKISSAGAGTGEAITYNGSGVTWDYPATKLTRVAITSANSPYTISGSTTLVGVDVSGGAVTVTLPTANSYPAGYVIVVKNELGNAATNNITIQRNGTDLINASSTNVLINSGTGTGSFRFYSDGVSRWHQF